MTGRDVCGCPTGPGITRPDPVAHKRFHDLVEEQTGIPYGTPVNAHTLQVARGHAARPPSLPTGAAPGRPRESPRRRAEQQARRRS